jgi:hypothetical protein
VANIVAQAEIVAIATRKLPLSFMVFDSPRTLLIRVHGLMNFNPYLLGHFLMPTDGRTLAKVVKRVNGFF